MMGAAENAELGFQDEEDILAGTAPPPRKMQLLDFEHIGSLAAVAESLSPRSKWRMALRSIRIVIFQAKINVLLPFGPLAITLHYLPGNHQGWVFLFSLVSITPLAERLGYGTEQLACYTGPTIGGLLNDPSDGKIHDWPSLSMDDNLQMIAKIAALCNDASIAHSEHQYVATGMPTEAALKKEKRVSDMKLAKDFAAAMEEFRKLQSIAMQREVAYKPVVPQNAQTRIIVAMVIAIESFISWMPMYGEIKLAFFVYLWYPKTQVQVQS